MFARKARPITHSSCMVGVCFEGAWYTVLVAVAAISRDSPRRGDSVVVALIVSRATFSSFVSWKLLLKVRTPKRKKRCFLFFSVWQYLLSFCLLCDVIATCTSLGLYLTVSGSRGTLWDGCDKRSRLQLYNGTGLALIDAQHAGR